MTRYLAPSAVDKWMQQDVERMQGPRMTPRLAIAHHESAHAIAVICAGRPLDSVEVDDRGGGKCYHRKVPTGGTMEQRLQWIGCEMRIISAGQEGQRYIAPHEMFRSCSLDRSDLDRLRSMAEILTGNPAQAEELLEDSRREARALIDEFWPLVEKLARELNKRGRLTGDEVRKILGLPPESSGLNDEEDEPEFWTRDDGRVAQGRRPPPGEELWSRTDGYFFTPAMKERPNPPPPDAGACATATRAFRQRHGAQG